MEKMETDYTEALKGRERRRRNPPSLCFLLFLFFFLEFEKWKQRHKYQTTTLRKGIIIIISGRHPRDIRSFSHDALNPQRHLIILLNTNSLSQTTVDYLAHSQSIKLAKWNDEKLKEGTRFILFSRKWENNIFSFLSTWTWAPVVWAELRGSFAVSVSFRSLEKSSYN